MFTHDMAEGVKARLLRPGEREAVLACGGRIAICGDPKTHSSSALAERARGEQS